MRITSKQRALFGLLRERDRTGGVVTRGEILEVTGYTAASFRTNVGKGLYSRFLSEVRPGEYEVTGAEDVTVEQFVQWTTQSLYVRELGYRCDSRLAKALLRKSRDNMILALELYNRPSLENRLDAFAMLFCAAWEQLLKAKLIEKDGEAAVFRDTSKPGPRKTVGLQHCVDGMGSADPIRRNLLRIKFLRDEATHLTMPEVQGVASHLFQAGVLNYSRVFRDFAGEPFLPKSPLGLLTLVADTRQPTPVHLKRAYGQSVGSEILDLVRTLAEEIESAADPSFAIPLAYSLVLTSTAGEADIVLSKATNAAREVAVVVKPKDHKKTHPYKQNDVVQRVNIEVRTRLRTEQLEVALVGRDKSGQPVFNRHDFTCIARKERWKNGENPFHHPLTEDEPVLHTYSEQAVDFIVGRVVDRPEYLRNLRARHRRNRRS